MVCHHAVTAGVFFVMPQFNLPVRAANGGIYRDDAVREFLPANYFREHLKVGWIRFKRIDLETRRQSVREQARRVADIGPDIENMAPLKKGRLAADQARKWIFPEFLVEKIRRDKGSFSPGIVQYPC